MDWFLYVNGLRHERVKEEFEMKKDCLKSDAVVRRCSVEKVFLAFSQNSQQNNCARVSILGRLFSFSNSFVGVQPFVTEKCFDDLR